jgi:hypothetical protein
MRGRAEAVQAQGLAAARRAIGSKADESRAEQRGGLLVRVAARELQAIPLVGDEKLRIAAIERITRETGRVAKVLGAEPTAVPAAAASRAEPWHANTRAERQTRRLAAARNDAPDDFVARYDRVGDIWQLAVEDVQVRAAYAAGAHLEQHLARGGDGRGHRVEDERLAGPMQAHRPHCSRNGGGNGGGSCHNFVILARNNTATFR